MNLFGGSRDWNVLAIIFERPEMYRVNAQRAQGGEAIKVRDGAKRHPRTLYWGVFDQQRKQLESGPGGGQHLIDGEILKRLERELAANMTVQQVLGILERKERPMAAKSLAWSGYPAVPEPTGDQESQ